MTKLSYAAAGFFALAAAACAVEQKPQTVEGDKAVVDAYVRAWNQRDTLALDTLIARNGIHEDFGQNYRLTGPKEVKAKMRETLAGEPDYKWTVNNSIEDGKAVALEWTWTSTYTGPDLTGAKVTNKRLSGKGSSIAVVDGGKVRRFTNYYDVASLFR